MNLKKNSHSHITIIADPAIHLLREQLWCKVRKRHRQEVMNWDPVKVTFSETGIAPRTNTAKDAHSTQKQEGSE